MYKPTPFKIPKQEPPQSKILNRIDGGLNVKYVESQISDEQSPNIENLNANDRGALTKRFGQTVFHTFSGGSIHALFYYKNKYVCAHSTKLSTWDGTTETAVKTGLANSDGVFFVVADTLLYLNGTDYVQWNGTAAADVEGFAPQISIGRTPSGGGTAKDDLNLLTPAFIDSFKGDGTSTAYTLSFDGLDATLLTASTDYGLNYDKLETTDFSVDRVNGIVTWSVAPADATLGTDDNVKIKAYKTQTGLVNMVKKNMYVAQYGGGSNDSRIFIAGDPDNPNVYRYTGLTGNAANDYRYFPENSFNRIGSDFKTITGFAKYYARLIVFKEEAIYSVNYTYSPSTGSSFPVQQLSSQFGCDMPRSIQIIGNAPVWCHTQYGVNTMVATLIESEKNVTPLSGNVNGASFRPGLLDETEANLKACSSVDYDGKYQLYVGSKGWIWDYTLSPYIPGQADDMLKWFYYTNINANCFLMASRELYHGDRTTGVVTKLIDDWNDYGAAIVGRWKSKLFDFDFFSWVKVVKEVRIKTRSGNNSTIKLNFYDDSNVLIDTQIIKTTSFSWASFSWAAFTWAVYRFPTVFTKKVKQKNVIHWQVEIVNDELNRNLSIMGLEASFSLEKKVK
jgi:hypothetical protein